MSLDITKIKDGFESVVNLTVGLFGLCCGHITMEQCTGFFSLIANAGGATLVIIQLVRTLKKKED